MHVHEGFTPEEAARTKAVLLHAEGKKSALVRNIDALLYWVALLLAILGNFLLAVVFVPYLVVLDGFGLYATLFFIGTSFGTLFSFLLRSIDRASRRHQLVASVLIPCIALISVTIITLLSNKLIILLDLATHPHNPIAVGAVYVFGYVLPDILLHFAK